MAELEEKYEDNVAGKYLVILEMKKKKKMKTEVIHTFTNNRKMKKKKSFAKKLWKAAQLKPLVILEMKKKKKTKDYDILPEDYEEDYIVWFW